MRQIRRIDKETDEKYKQRETDRQIRWTGRDIRFINRQIRWSGRNIIFINRQTDQMDRQKYQIYKQMDRHTDQIEKQVIDR